MTPQEALAEALEDVSAKHNLPMPGFYTTARYILDALPEGWGLYRLKHAKAADGTWEAYYMEKGAQQERERLRKVPILGDADGMRPYSLPEWVKTPTPKGQAPIDLLEHFREWLLTDPDEADR